jgi:D-tyrosyl-tRNA(Tyr) deacylase
MRAVVQRVKEARVDVEGGTVGEIGNGLLVLLGVGEDDSEKDCEYLANKVAHLPFPH